MEEPPNGSVSIHVRPATPDDVPDLVSFQVAMARETEGKELHPERVEQGVRGVFEVPSRGRYWIAECDVGGDSIGSLLLTYEWSDWRAGTFWWIQSVFVRAGDRGRGAFRALYEKVLRDARAASDVCGVRLYVDHDNRTAQDVYAKVGMSESHYRFFEVDFVHGDEAGGSAAPGATAGR